MRVYQNQRRYHRALVEVERVLLEYIDVIYEIGGDIAGLRNSVAAERVQWTLPRGFLLRRDVIRELASGPLVNELFALNREVRRANADLENLGTAYATVRQRYLETADKAQYLELAKGIANGYEIVAGILPDTLDMVQRALARTRCLVVRDTPTWKGWLRLRGQVSRVSEKELRTALDKVYVEAAPRARIRKVDLP